MSSISQQHEAVAHPATDGLVPFYGNVSDVFMMDKSQVQLFTTLGSTRSPFQKITTWPNLNEVMARRSQEYWKEKGEAAWRQAGGIRDENGNYTCYPMSDIASDVVRELAHDLGGVIWDNPDGSRWAVRLVPTPGKNTGSFFGYAVSLPSPASRRSSRTSSGDATRGDPVVSGLRLYKRAEQLLFTIHWAVLKQRSSVVMLPDVLLGQVIWGGDRGSWPKDWRADLLVALKSLMALRVEVLRVSSAGWRPQFGAISTAVAHVEDLMVTRPIENHCRTWCPMDQSGVKHNHILVQVGLGFLGVMEKFSREDENGCRVYDFVHFPEDNDRKKDIQDAQQSGQLVSLNGPMALFGRGEGSGLSQAATRIVHALMAEVSRGQDKVSQARSDKAAVFVGNRVPGRTEHEIIECSLLMPNRRYIAFGGNGNRHGMGYQIVGEKSTGWLFRCGYIVPESELELARVVREFLTDLGELVEVLHLTVVGWNLGTGEFLDRDTLRCIARQRHGVSMLSSIHLRVYAPEDYLDRCRGYCEQLGNFTSIPGGTLRAASETSLATGRLNTLIYRAGIKQVELADRLELPQQYVSQLMKGTRPWPEAHRQKVLTFVSERLGDVSESGA